MIQARSGLPPILNETSSSEKHRLKPLTPERLLGNAYRTLGLSASASQADIEAAARRMRIWRDASRIPPTPWDLPWLGPLTRTRNDIEQAVTRLNEPASRLQDRLFWYHRSLPPQPEDTAGPPGGTNENSVSGRHDEAISALHAALLPDFDPTDLGALRLIAERFRDISKLPEGLAWAADVEHGGRFEKPASSAEISAALAELPKMFANALATSAITALSKNKQEIGLGLGQLVRDADPVAMQSLLDRLEDDIFTRSTELDGALRPKLWTIHSNPSPFFAANLAATEATASEFERSCRPLFTAIQHFAADDPARLMRVGSKVSSLLALVALGWEWSGRVVNAIQTLREALELSRGTQGEAEIRANLERLDKWVSPELHRPTPPAPISTPITTAPLETVTPLQKTRYQKALQATAFCISCLWSLLGRPQPGVNERHKLLTGVFLLCGFFIVMGVLILFSDTSSRPVAVRQPQATPRDLRTSSDPLRDLYSHLPPVTTQPSSIGEAAREK